MSDMKGFVVTYVGDDGNEHEVRVESSSARDAIDDAYGTLPGGAEIVAVVPDGLWCSPSSAEAK